MAVIEQVTAAFRGQDWTHGSGLVRDAVVAQLRSVLPLLGAQVSPEVRPRFMVATADLAMQAGWASFECQQHEAARRLWVIGLNIARDAAHPRAGDLTVFLLYDMTLQAVELGRLDEAQDLARIGQATATGGRHPVSAEITCALANLQARACAAQGDATACDRALGQATDRFSTIDLSDASQWSSVANAKAGFSALQGAAYYTLASVERDPHAARRAVQLLCHAVDRYGPAARIQARYLTDLVGAHVLAGDTDTAVSVGHRAVDAVTALSSPRLHDRLRTLHTVLGSLHASPGVAELRERLATTAAA